MADELPRRSGRRGHAGRRRSNAKHHDDVGHFGDAARPPVLLGRTSDTGQDVRTSRLDLGAGSSKVEQRQPMCPQEQSRQLAPPSASSSVVAPGCAARTTAPQQADAAVPTWSPQGFFLAPWVYLQNPLVAQSWGAVATAPLPTAAAAGLQTANTQPADAAVLGVAQQPMQQQMQQHMQQLLQVQQMQQMQPAAPLEAESFVAPLAGGAAAAAAPAPALASEKKSSKKTSSKKPKKTSARKSKGCC
mmetsp:Transcript_23224/g.66068  ORF Transcript_23224/g.66068 Transcript_23224/m.66068 type:complete len:246 (+) Transcript_23224:85-822(+)